MEDALIYIVSGLLAIVSFLLKDLYSRQGIVNEQVLSMQKQGHELRITRLEDRAIRRDEDAKNFYKDLPAQISKALTPQFDALNLRIERIEEDIRQAK